MSLLSWLGQQIFSWLPADRLEQVSPLWMLGRMPAREIKYGGDLGELFLPGQKAKLLLVDHTVGCRMESTFLSSPVRNTLGFLSVLLPDSGAGWAQVLTGESCSTSAGSGGLVTHRQREQLGVIFVILL